MPAQTQYPIAELLDAVRRAGDAIMEIYRAGFEVRRKADASPVTEADLAAHGLLAEALQGLMPSIPLVSEEAPLPPYSERRRWRRFWLIDPLDGTKEFIARNGEFTVNIALIEDGQPRLGLVAFRRRAGFTWARLRPAGRNCTSMARRGASGRAPCRKGARSP